MNCADCKTRHHGIAGLVPVRVSAVVRGMKSYDMVCGDCSKERREASGKYKAATHGE